MKQDASLDAYLSAFGEPPRRRHRRLKSLALVPTLITLGNLLCGFAAIHFAMRAMIDFGAGIPVDRVATMHNSIMERLLPSFLSVGASFVFLGMIFDCFDGLIARATRSTTNFGGQLDSLADVVTCGVAPAILMIAFMTTQLASSAIVPSPLSPNVLGRATWGAAAIYVAFAAIRLARYNVEHASDEFDHRMFRGLPSPGAAAIVATMILFQDQLGAYGKYGVLIALPFIAFAAALLMVSRVPYKRFYRAYLMGKQPVGRFLIVVLMLGVFLVFPVQTLVVAVLWYGISGPVFLLVRNMRGRSSNAAAGKPLEKPEVRSAV